MKKSNKKIPKTHLPKYSLGVKTPVTRTLSNGNEVSYAEDNVDMGEGTQNIYNQKRSFGKNIGQYAGYAAAAGQTASNLAAINEQDYNGDTKAAYQSQAIGSGITQGMGSLSPYIAMGTGIRKSATGMIGDKQGANRTLSNWAAAPHEAASSDIAAANNSQNTQSQKIGGYMSAIGDITGMSKMRQMFSYGTGNDEKTTGFWGKYNDLSGISARNNQKNSLEQENLAAQKAQEDAYAQQQTDYQNQQQSMMDAAFARGFANQNQTGGGAYVQYAKYGGQMKYAMGGMNIQPNAEVEGNEMITSNTPPQVFANGGVELASNNPYGTPTYKTNGASHENGGIPMNMAPGSIVNGKTINPLTGNKFTKDINILAKQENKYTKKAESGDKFSNTNAKLILPILAQKKDYLNNLQNAIIANQKQAKALSRGELPQVPMDNQQMQSQGMPEQPQGEMPMARYGGMMNKMPMGGVQLPYYNTDNAGNPIYAMGGGYPAMTNPYNNFRGSIPMYPDGGINVQGLTKPQYEQAQRDSMTLYKSGFGKVPNYQFPGFTEASMREGTRTNPRSPAIKTATGQPYGSDAGVNMMDSEASNFSNFKPTRVPWQEYIPGTKDAGVDVENVVPVKNPVMHPKYDHYIPGIKKSRQPVIIEQFSKGGKKSAKVPESLRFVPKMADESEGEDVIVPGVPQYETDYTDVLPPDRYNTFGKPLDTWSAARLNKSAWDEDYINNPNAKKPTEETNPNSKNFDWGKLTMNVGNFAGQNAGNIYDLSRKNAPLQKYDRATASYLDATAAMRDANEQTRRAEYNVRGASGGNAGTYLANRVGLNAQNIMTKDRIRQQYANANAQIGNQLSQYNTEIAYREAEARAKDAAMKENIRSQAIHGIGSSFGKATKSGKQDEMDEKTLAMYKEYYNNPQFRAALKKAGYDV